MLVFIVIIIGGLGSVGGCFLGALLVGLMANYTGFLAPKVALVSNILLMVADPAVAAAGPLSRGQAVSAMLQRAPLRRPAAQPRARASCWSLILVGAGAGAVPVPGRARRSTSRPRSASSSCWWRATTCCSATPASSRFAHTMFFGIGAYGVAHRALRAGARRWTAVAGRPRHRAASPASRCWRSLIGLFSLRVRAIFFAMITLAVASAFADPGLAALRLHRRRGRPHVPRAGVAAARLHARSTCRSSARRSRAASSPTTSCSSSALVLFLALLRIVNSPFGRVLQAIRENDFRAEAIGYRTVVYRTLANCLAAGMATLAGALLRALAALHRARHHALLRHHARHPADGGDRRHGHDVRRGDRRDAVRARAELPAGPDGHRRRGAPRRCRCCRACCTPTAGCSGSACCSCSASTSSRPASSASCGNDEVDNPSERPLKRRRRDRIA